MLPQVMLGVMCVTSSDVGCNDVLPQVMLGVMMCCLN